jgi:hypothetical protein
VTTVMLREIEKQSEGIIEHVDFLRDNAGVAPFAGDRATTEELLAVVTHSTGELREAAEWHVPIYVGRCFIEELHGHWSVETTKRSAMYGKAYVDGFGNIGYENLYLPYLAVTEHKDISRIDRLWKQSRRAYEIREQFQAEFDSLSGTTAIREDIEDRCIELGILPKTPMRFKVDRARVPLYCREMQIRLKKRG